MKTRKIRTKKYRYDILLTLSGWGLAIFVSLLYLYDKSTPIVVEQTPKTIERPTAVRSDRVETLMYESRMLLSRNRPVEAINRITTLWSVCHTTHQEVPDESHRVFAQAVSMMSHDRSQPQSVLVAPEKQGKKEPVYLEPLSEPADSKGVSVKKPKSKEDGQKKPTLTIPTPSYPLAKGEPHDRTSRPAPPPPRHRADGKRPPAFPSSPPPHEGNGRFPVPPPPPRRDSDGAWKRVPPRPPHHRQSARMERKAPLDADAGGQPPGYLNY
jgi:hypothetical protein